MGTGPELEPAIHTVGLSKSYGAVRAVDDLSMTVPRGEIFGFLGPNGAGKTTSVKLLTGLSNPTSGKAWLLGKPVGDVATRGRIGYLPELFRYQGWMSAVEVLRLHCELADVPVKRRRAETEEALVLVGLADRANDKVNTFSKGMQQRLGLGVSLLGKPDLVFLDEPTSALDPVGRKEVRDIIVELRSRGITVFLNSHLLSEVQQVCDRVAVIDRGRVVASGTMAELLGSGEIRIQVTDLDEAGMQAIAGFGKAFRSEEWLTVVGVDPQRVPDLVAELVRLGARVHAVERGRQTLEERFIQLLDRT
ncbi:MAG TPA: ABC transporter ATP-binding protein [Actinomycetota bacterium]|nr:ABC transporter ATP-binding protein [Actinomycetota bacterium]